MLAACGELRFLCRKNHSSAEQEELCSVAYLKGYANGSCSSRVLLLAASDEADASSNEGCVPRLLCAATVLHCRSFTNKSVIH